MKAMYCSCIQIKLGWGGDTICGGGGIDEPIKKIKFYRPAAHSSHGLINHAHFTNDSKILILCSIIA